MALLQAHRGVSSEAPENTMAAFRMSVEQGYDLIEMDPKYTADGKFVILHDISLNRTVRDADGNAVDLKISEITLAQAQSYDYGSWFSEEFKGEKKRKIFDGFIRIKRRSIMPLIGNPNESLENTIESFRST